MLENKEEKVSLVPDVWGDVFEAVPEVQGNTVEV